VAEQEPVRQGRRRARAEVLEDLAEELGLRGVGDQQQDDGSDSRTTANISPSVPFFSSKPACGPRPAIRCRRAGRPSP